MKITADSCGTPLDVTGSERCEIARCSAADDGTEPVISDEVKEGSARDWSGERIERTMATLGNAVLDEQWRVKRLAELATQPLSKTPKV